MIPFSPLHEEDIIIVPNLQKGRLMMKEHLCSPDLLCTFFWPSLHPEVLTSQDYFPWSPWPLGFVLGLTVGRTKRDEVWEKRSEYLFTCLRFCQRMSFSMITAQITGTTCVSPFSPANCNLLSSSFLISLQVKTTSCCCQCWLFIVFCSFGNSAHSC